ncbi:uncharacterized protein [Nicotiana tomentosiformis]|uniref:uncharacterized protein n=1 Tax=Nicotiana tomentosiformis TaxID=4098 RepID=UPI00388CBE56
MALYEALYGRRCHSLVGWFDPGEARLVDTNLVCDALEKIKLIQERLCTVQSRQKSYADRKPRDVAFMMGEKILLRMFPMNGAIRFIKKGKLIPRYYEDLSHVLDFSSVQLDKDLAYVEELMAILDRGGWFGFGKGLDYIGTLSSMVGSLSYKS